MIPGITGKFDLGVQNEVGQRITSFYQENELFMEPATYRFQSRRFQAVEYKEYSPLSLALFTHFKGVQGSG